MADIEKVEDVTKGLKGNQKEKVAEFVKSQAERLKRRGKEARDMARQRGVVFSSVVAAAGGVAAEGVRRKLIGRYAKTPQNQGVGLILAGVAVKYLARYARIPLLHDLGDAHIAQGAAVGSMEMIYGAEDPMTIALAGTVPEDKK